MELLRIVSCDTGDICIREQGSAARVFDQKSPGQEGPDQERSGQPQSKTPPWLTAVRAAESKKAHNICVLDLRDVTSFADYFIICGGANPRQIQAISEEIGQQLRKQGEYPMNVEGFDSAEWVLADYGNYLVHVFSDKARAYYDLERLWRHAKNVKISD
jgi:ribosome-associated protein